MEHHEVFADQLSGMLTDYAEKLSYISKHQDAEFAGEIVEVDQGGREREGGAWYKIKIIDDDILNGMICFLSYGDILDYSEIMKARLKQFVNENVPIPVPNDRITTGIKFPVGTKIKFKVAFTLRAFDVYKAKD